MPLDGAHRLDDLCPTARAVLSPIVDEISDAGLPYMVYETARTVERQRKLYAAGASQIEDDGAHVRRAAVDLVLVAGAVPGAHGPWDLGLDDERRTVIRPDVWAIWRSLAGILAPHHVRREIAWGGVWGHASRLIGWDPYHVELRHWRHLPRQTDA